MRTSGWRLTGRSQRSPYSNFAMRIDFGQPAVVWLLAHGWRNFLQGCFSSGLNYMVIYCEISADVVVAV